MQFQIEKDELLRKLSDTIKIVENTSAVGVTNHALIIVNNGSSQVMATNMDTTIIQNLTLTADAPGKVCVPAKKLLDMTRELDKPLTCELKDSTLKLKSGNHKFNLQCLDPESFPVMPEFTEDISMILEGKVLLAMIEKSDYAAPEKDARIILNSVLFHLKTNGSLTLAATDGHRLSLVRKKIPVPVETEAKYIMPIKAVAYLTKMIKPERQVTIRLNKNLASFMFDGKTLITKLLEGSFPSYESIIPKENDKVITGVDKGELTKALKLAIIISGEKGVVLALTKNKLTIAAKDNDLGNSSTEIAIAFDGEDMTLALSAGFLLDALEVTESDTVTIKIKDPVSPVLIEDISDKGFKSIVMPMRL